MLAILVGLDFFHERFFFPPLLYDCYILEFYSTQCRNYIYIYKDLQARAAPFFFFF